MTRDAVRTPDPVGRLVRRVAGCYAAAAVLAAASVPLWAWGRPDRAMGLLVGMLVVGVRFAITVRAARGAEWSGPRRYALARAASLAVVAGGLIAAGLAPALDLHAAVAGVLLGTAAQVSAALLEARRLGREEAALESLPSKE